MQTVVPRMMWAALLAGPRKIIARKIPVPVPRAGEALVRVRAVGICRSDIHYYRDGRIGDQVIRKWPQLLGHEAAGEAWTVPAGERRVRVGERVAIEPATPCGRCIYCRQGRGNTCPSVGFLGMPGNPGAFAEFITMRTENLVKLPARATFEEGVALEPMAIGLHAVRLFPGRIREAAVVGVGPVGLAVLAALRMEHKARVTVFDRLPGRLRVAKVMGAVAGVRVGRGPAVLPGRKWDFVFEAGGTEGSVELSLALAAPGGGVALIGILDGARSPVNLHLARRKELVLRNVRRSNDELGECVRMVASGRLDLSPMISHRGGLEDTAKFFRLAEEYRDGVVKAVINP
jgi:L-iditol 2-dehydrogenase